MILLYTVGSSLKVYLTWAYKLLTHPPKKERKREWALQLAHKQIGKTCVT